MCRAQKQMLRTENITRAVFHPPLKDKDRRAQGWTHAATPHPGAEALAEALGPIRMPRPMHHLRETVVCGLPWCGRARWAPYALCSRGPVPHLTHTGTRSLTLPTKKQKTCIATGLLDGLCNSFIFPFGFLWNELRRRHLCCSGVIWSSVCF